MNKSFVRIGTAVWLVGFFLPSVLAVAAGAAAGATTATAAATTVARTTTLVNDEAPSIHSGVDHVVSIDLPTGAYGNDDVSIRRDLSKTFGIGKWAKFLYALKICPGPKLCPKPPCLHNGHDPDHWNCEDKDSDSSSSSSSSTSSTTTTKSSGGGGDDDDDDDYFTNDSSGRDMTGTGWSQENVGNRRFNAVAYIAMAMVGMLFLAAMAAYRKKMERRRTHPLFGGVSKRMHLAEQGDLPTEDNKDAPKPPKMIEIELPAATDDSQYARMQD